MKCQFCSKEYESKIAFSNHVRRCPSNPSRITETLTDSGREKIRQNTIRLNSKHWNDPEFRKKHQSAMKRAVAENPESYSSSNRGRTKQITVDGIKFQGQWEVDFYLWAKAAGLEPQRPKEGFSYEWKGLRTYFPDFYLPGLDLYVEIKGYETERDRSKWSQFPKKLRIIKAAEIKQIRQNCFVGL